MKHGHSEDAASPRFIYPERLCGNALGIFAGFCLSYQVRLSSCELVASAPSRRA